MHSDDDIKKFIEVGKILTEIRKTVWKDIKPGLNLLDLAKKIEAETEKRNAKPAFPVNISVDDHTAHYTPSFDEKREIKESELVKVDIGVQIDGYMADSALTYCSEKNNLIEANNEVLEKVLEIIKPGLEVSEIGKLIDEFMKEKGLGVIVNLTGHGIGVNDFHKYPTISNVRNDNNYTLQENEVIAIEPFVCEGGGFVNESGIKEIFRYLQDKPVRSNDARQILAHIRDNFGSFPFAKRWLIESFSPMKASVALKQLEAVGAIESYPLLKEKNGKKVSQSEYTIIVKDKPIVTTPFDL